jgi:hypothetical protein
MLRLDKVGGFEVATSGRFWVAAGESLDDLIARNVELEQRVALLESKNK